VSLDPSVFLTSPRHRLSSSTFMSSLRDCTLNYQYINFHRGRGMHNGPKCIPNPRNQSHSGQETSGTAVPGVSSRKSTKVDLSRKQSISLSEWAVLQSTALHWWGMRDWRRTIAESWGFGDAVRIGDYSGSRYQPLGFQHHKVCKNLGQFHVNIMFLHYWHQ